MPIFRRLAAAALIAAGLVCSLHAQSSDPAAERGFAALQRGEADVEGRFEAFKDDRFTIMFSGPAQHQLAAHATKTMGAAFFKIAAALGSAPSAPIRVVLYTERQFQDITGAPEWAGGGFDGQI